MKQLLRFCGWTLLVACCCATTCERPVDLDLNGPPRRLVISSDFNLDRVWVQVSTTQGAFDPEDPTDIANATVTLWQGDQFIEELVLVVEPAERIPSYYRTVAFRPETEVTYTIIAEAPGFEPATARSFIPVPVPITDLSVNDIQIVADSLNREKAYTYSLSVDFDDPPNEDNFYHLNVFQEVITFSLNEALDTVVDDRTLLRVDFELMEESVVQDHIIGGALFQDNPFPDGLSLDLTVKIVPEFQFLGKLYVELRTVTEEYYRFYDSYSRQQEQVDAAFIDHTIPFNNIENGHGYFAGYNLTQDSLKIEF